MIKNNPISVTKKHNFSEWYIEVIVKAKIADYTPVKGFMVLRPDGYSIWDSIKESIDNKLKKTGHKNAFLPILIPESLLSKEKNHFMGFNPEVFWITRSKKSISDDRLALRPTSEALAYHMYSKWIKSWRDLPLKINFWNTALRAEIKGTKPFIRTSEFLWQEGHTAHIKKNEAEEEVYNILEIYKKTIEEELAIPVLAGKKTDNEKFVGAVYTTTMETIMPDGKALQMGTSHFLGQNFSKPFEIKFLDKNNDKCYVWQTSWGISWRLIGAMIMIHGDDNGIVLPPNISPIQVVIIPIYYSKNKASDIFFSANKIKNIMSNKNIRSYVDERKEVTPGFKFNEWELKGIPLRIEIGPNDIKNERVILVVRHNKKNITMPIKELGNNITNILDQIQSDMFNSAKKNLDKKTTKVKDYKQFKIQLKKKKFIIAPWCGNINCELKIKKETGADIRLIPFNSIYNANTKCISCNARCDIQPLFAYGY